MLKNSNIYLVGKNEMNVYVANRIDYIKQNASEKQNKRKLNKKFHLMQWKSFENFTRKCKSFEDFTK